MPCSINPFPALAGIVVVLSLHFTPFTYAYSESPWTWRCSDGISCQRQLANGSEPQVSLNVCWLTCGEYGALWPQPTIKTFMGTHLVGFYAQNAEVVAINAPHKAVKAMLGYAGNVLLDHLFRMSPKDDDVSPSQNNRGFEQNYLAITLTAQNTDTRISLGTDESYNLTISAFYGSGGTQVNVDIVGATYFGVRHGLETLGQLIAHDEFNKCLRIVKEAAIEDRPAFAYRGLMIDTSRNFIPILYLKRMVDAMSYNRMMTTYGAYSKSQIYTPKDVKELVLYARLRGVKIIPELDAPAHAGNGWQWGPEEGLGELALCVNAEPWRSYCGQPPCGQLNPVNNYTYLVLKIRNWLHNKGTHDLMDLWGHFQQKAFERLIEANGGHYIKPIVWTSDMTSRGRQHLSPNDYIIQIWTGSSHTDVREILQEKYKVIISNVDAAYLDHGYGSWLGRDHMWTIKTWQNLYDNDLIKITEYHLGANATYHVLAAGQILGGEAVLWAEKVDQHNMEMKLWPRSAAFAERLWSSPRNRSNSVYPRLLHHRARMVRRGIHADRLQPESCHQISGYCSDPSSRL
ncbi:Chitooligosaccharidolytic beta-N-acetylglucosaminidase [Orchesella cincta]|uniref:Beta-hexosaminidase n=1 Tax=Orchesella cincta TaxID=48709 RepID=A0A1D2N1M9_ORCCI|nr:Chitooligosaccharidolytic beta-N-acetylglucosaminidase [Orchesella cincta]